VFFHHCSSHQNNTFYRLQCKSNNTWNLSPSSLCIMHCSSFTVDLQNWVSDARNVCLSHPWDRINFDRKMFSTAQILQAAIYTTNAHTHTYPFNGPFPGLPGLAGTRKVKPIWILAKQKTVSGSGISCIICKSAPRSRQITTPAPHHSVFYRLDALPTNSVKALDATGKNNCYCHVWIKWCHVNCALCDTDIDYAAV